MHSRCGTRAVRSGRGRAGEDELDLVGVEVGVEGRKDLARGREGRDVGGLRASDSGRALRGDRARGCRALAGLPGTREGP